MRSAPKRAWSRGASAKEWRDVAEEVARRTYIGRCFSAASGSGSGPGLGAHVRSASEIPALVIDANSCYVARCKGDFLIAPDFYNAPLARDTLIEGSSVSELHGNDLIADARFSSLFQEIEKTTGDWN